MPRGICKLILLIHPCSPISEISSSLVKYCERLSFEECQSPGIASDEPIILCVIQFYVVSMVLLVLWTDGNIF